MHLLTAQTLGSHRCWGPLVRFPVMIAWGGAASSIFNRTSADSRPSKQCPALGRCTATLAPPYLACAAVRLCLLDFDFKRPSILVDEKFERPPPHQPLPSKIEMWSVFIGVYASKRVTGD
jgi:hypothetical protein